MSGAGASSFAAPASPALGYGASPRARRSGGVMDQLMNMSTSGKIKLGIVALSGLVLAGVVLVALLFTIADMAGSFNSQPSRDMPNNINNPDGKRSTLAQITGKFASLERTATPTPLPATAVPTAKATAKPTTKKPAVATPKTVSKPVAQPTATDVVASAASPAQPVRTPLAPRIWDQRLGAGGLPLLTGVGVTDANVQSGQSFFRLTKMVFQDAGAESGNDHTIYVTILDENGQRTENQTVLITWDQSGATEQQRLGVTNQKPRGDYCNCNYNWPMYGAGYRVRVDGSLPSDEVYGMIMPEHRHVNYLLTFQQVVMP